MISGVLRLRIEAAGPFDLGHILWKQVRWWRYFFASLKSTNVNF